MPWASFSMLDGPGGTRFLQSEVKIILIIVQDQDGQNNNILKGRSGLGSNDHPIKTNTILLDYAHFDHLKISKIWGLWDLGL